MQDIQPELIEKYQLILEKDPRSQVFAPLSEAYRKLEMIDEALKICLRGVQYNANFAGGRIALAKVMMEKENYTAAAEELSKAVELSPDNILAHTLLGECYLTLKRPKEALRSFKMVLFLAPNNEKAAKAVRKLESLTADEYDNEVFQMKRLPDLSEEQTPRLQPLESGQLGSEKITSLERYLSLLDAYIVRNEIDKAWDLATEAERYHSGHKELEKRVKLLQQRIEEVTTDEPENKPPSRKKLVLEGKIKLLNTLLTNVRSHSQFTDHD